MPDSPDSSLSLATPWLSRLGGELDKDWPAIRKARKQTFERRQNLEAVFKDLQSGDASLVVFGSVARQEITGGSDLDWILLVDGQSMPEHKAQQSRIAKALIDNGFIEPGASGIFGTMAGSHDLIHNIGGGDDSNANTTRRILLLLESIPVGSPEAWARVRKQILRRYLEDDRGLLYASGDIRLPRFLLNDLTRYWRTITVDFVYKQRADNDRKWALRNAKLRMSRKLLYAAGLLHCFFCQLDPLAEPARRGLRGPDLDVAPLGLYVEEQLAVPPLEMLAKACVLLRIQKQTALNIFNSYDRFLSILDDQGKRDELAAASTHADLRTSSAWNEIREVSNPFHEGLVHLFLSDNDSLRELTMKYGIF
jgi:predicted nucleotidyltransferase